MERFDKLDLVEWKNSVLAVSNLNFYISMDFLVGLQWYPFELLKKGFLLVYTHLKSENHVQNKAFSYASVLVVLFPIFVALKISNHVERV